MLMITVKYAGERKAVSDCMAVAELLSYKQFSKFMFLEYGYTPNQLLDLSASDLHAYMVEWYIRLSLPLVLLVSV